MKIFLSMRVAAVMTIFICFFSVLNLIGQNVGVGTPIPDYRLHVANSNPSLLKLDNTTALAIDVRSDLFFKTGNFYTGAIKTIATASNFARLGLFTFATGNPLNLEERISILDGGNVGIGVTNPGYLLDVNGRMRIRNGGGTAGLYLMNVANDDNRAFMGMFNDNYVGLYGDNGAGWGMVMNVTVGAVGIGTTNPQANLHVNGDFGTEVLIENTSTAVGPIGLEVEAISHNSAIAISARGAIIGIEGLAQVEGSGNRFGLYGTASNHIGGTNYGVYGYAYFGPNNIGVYGRGEDNGGTFWGGYFTGSVYTTGTYQGSDRKLKNDIQPLDDAMGLINQLKPSAYTYKTVEYPQMQLPEGIQYGLIADEVLQVIPGAVKRTVQPAEYENNDNVNGKKLSDAVEFNSINYTEMIPILIGAVQEQQATIKDQQKKIDDLEKRIIAMEKE